MIPVRDRAARRRAGGGVALVVTGLLFVGCTAAEPIPNGTTTPRMPASAAVPAPGALPAGVSVSLVQNRDDIGPRRIEILVDNATASEVRILSAELVSPAFASPAAYPRTTTVPAGAARALRVDLAPPACGPVGASAGGSAGAVPSATVDLVLGTEEGASSTSTEASDPYGALAAIHTDDCLAERLARHVVVTAAGPLRVVHADGAPVHAELDLALSPTGSAGSVVLTAVDRTILLRPADGSPGWPVDLTITADSAPETITLDLVPANCNTHTVSEDKRGTFFPLAIAFEDGATGIVHVPVDRALRGQIYAFIAHDACGWS